LYNQIEIALNINFKIKFKIIYTHIIRNTWYMSQLLKIKYEYINKVNITLKYKYYNINKNITKIFF